VLAGSDTFRAVALAALDDAEASSDSAG
jgi:hypothetical protein